MSVVFTNGCFDVLHAGHFNLLSYCRLLAGHDGLVVVALDSDEKIAKDKGLNRPIFTFDERKRALKDLMYQSKEFRNEPTMAPLVNVVGFFNSNEDLYHHIRAVQPNIIVKGSDWQDKVVIGSDLAEVKFFKAINHRTTNIIARVLEKHK